MDERENQPLNPRATATPNIMASSGALICLIRRQATKAEPTTSPKNKPAIRIG